MAVAKAIRRRQAVVHVPRVDGERRPDVVVVDFVMPGMSGADVARTMLQEQPDQPILFVSGYSQTDAIKQAAPQAPMLAKPFRAEALDEMVRGLLAARPAGVGGPNA